MATVQAVRRLVSRYYPFVFAPVHHSWEIFSLYPPDAFVFSVTSPWRTFPPTGKTNLHNPLVMLASLLRCHCWAALSRSVLLQFHPAVLGSGVWRRLAPLLNGYTAASYHATVIRTCSRTSGPIGYSSRRCTSA